MMTRLYTRIRGNITDLANKNMSKATFMAILREELGTFFPNREFKVIDTSDTRGTSINPHIPILFIEPCSYEGKFEVSYNLLINIDKIGSTDVITPEIFMGALTYQLDNIDDNTKQIVELFDNEMPLDFEQVVKAYLENHVCLIKYLREQYPQDFSFGMINGTVASDREFEILIDRIDFDKILDIDAEFLDVMEAKYHLPAIMGKLIKKARDHKR